MTEAIESLFGFGKESILFGCLVFLRVGAAIALLPVVGERSLPSRIRLILALLFTLIVAPAVFEDYVADQLELPQLAMMVFSEVTIGLGLGFSLRLFVIALQVAGSIAAQSTSLSQLFGGAGVDPQPAIGHLLVAAGLALAVTLGLHVQMAKYLIYSYEVFAFGQPVAASHFSSWGVARISHGFALGFSLAAPFLVASLIYNIALGAINRAMPQMMVSFVGAPAVTAGGLILLFVAAPLMLSVWFEAMTLHLQNPFGGAP